MQRSPAMFVCLVDLSKSDETICQSLHYWLNFIDNACSSIEQRSHVVVVGSHADQVASSEEKSLLLSMIIDSRRVKRQQYVGCIVMDCRRTDGAGALNLISSLTDSQKAITSSQPSISY